MYTNEELERAIYHAIDTLTEYRHEDVFTRSRKAELVLIRSVAYALLFDFGHGSQMALAKYFDGARDRTNILYLLKSLDYQRRASPETKRLYDTMRTEVENAIKTGGVTYSLTVDGETFDAFSRASVASLMAEFFDKGYDEIIIRKNG